MARLWHAARAAVVSPELTALRSVESFAARLGAALDLLRVAGLTGAALGLCIIRHDHLDQIYIASAARGTGLARALLRGGETRLYAAGVRRACLDCAEGNARAARLYVRKNWQNLGPGIAPVETAVGPMPLRVILFEKDLSPSPAS